MMIYITNLNIQDFSHQNIKKKMEWKTSFFSFSFEIHSNCLLCGSNFECFRGVKKNEIRFENSKKNFGNLKMNLDV